MKLADCTVINDVTYLFDYYQIGPEQDPDWIIMLDVMSNIPDVFKLENNIIVVRKKNSLLTDIIECLEGKFDILIYLGDEKPETTFSNSSLQIYTQYWNDKLPSYIRFWPVFTDNKNFLTNYNNRKKEKKLDFFFSGNLNKNRVLLFCEVTWSNVLFRNMMMVIIKKGNFKFLKYVFIYLRNLAKSDSRIHINFTSKFGSGLPQNDYFTKIQNSRFVLCPKGFQSAWTFRIYEAITCDCVPVILQSDFSSTRLPPALIVNSWSEIFEMDSKACERVYELEILKVREFRERWFTTKNLAKHIYNNNNNSSANEV